jgi:uncharacterized RDD family membrane protein YckC
MAVAGEYRYAGFWWRVLAAIVDGVILMVASSVLARVLGVGPDSFGDDGNSNRGLLSLITLVGDWLYFALLESSSLQATLGKAACGIIVTDDQGHRISFGRATGRYFAKIVSALILMIGFMMAGWTRRKQALHDLMAGTLVLKRLPERGSVTLPPPDSTAGIRIG